MRIVIINTQRNDIGSEIVKLKLYGHEVHEFTELLKAETVESKLAVLISQQDLCYEYLIKAEVIYRCPKNLDDLLERMLSLPVNAENIIEYGELALDCMNRCLMSHQSAISLKNKEFDLMKFFFDNANERLRKADIVEEVWDMNALINTNTLEVHVSKLRKKLVSLGIKHKYIKTLFSYGYLFS